jgi:hypothetical protein
VVGGVTEETDHPSHETYELQMACLGLGRALAAAGVHVIVCSPFPDSADYYVARAYADAGGQGAIHFHSPKHPDVDAKHSELLQVLGDDRPRVVVWDHPGPEGADAWPQAWLLAQLQALEAADAVVAIGGKVSQTANTILHLAEGRRIPVVPYAFLGGAAQRSFARRDWRRLYPELDANLLQTSTGIGRVVELANAMVMESVFASSTTPTDPRTFFVSRSNEDAHVAEELLKYLRSAGFEVVVGDLVVSPDRMVIASIEQALLDSDICIVLWSQQYALSPWCYDELMLALDAQRTGKLGLWIFTIDDSPIVPREARRMQVVRATTVTALLVAVKELLTGLSRSSL